MTLLCTTKPCHWSAPRTTPSWKVLLNVSLQQCTMNGTYRRHLSTTKHVLPTTDTLILLSALTACQGAPRLTAAARSCLDLLFVSLPRRWHHQARELSAMVVQPRVPMLTVLLLEVQRGTKTHSAMTTIRVPAMRWNHFQLVWVLLPRMETHSQSVTLLNPLKQRSKDPFLIIVHHLGPCSSH
jgi:hypothetical protein